MTMTRTDVSGVRQRIERMRRAGDSSWLLGIVACEHRLFADPEWVGVGRCDSSNHGCEV